MSKKGKDHGKPAADLDGNNPAGVSAGTESGPAADPDGAAAELAVAAVPGDAVEPSTRTDNAEPAAISPVRQPAMAAGPKDAEAKDLEAAVELMEDGEDFAKGHGDGQAGEHSCPVCDEPFKAGDQCATDIELGICHAACLEGSPTVDLNTGDPVGGPIPTYPYEAEASNDGQEAQPVLENADGAAASRPDHPDRKGDAVALDAGIPTDHDPAVHDAETGDTGSADPAGGESGEADARADEDIDLDDEVNGFDLGYFAGSCAAMARLYTAKGMAIRYDEAFSRDDATAMAEFVRANPDAPAEAAWIDLALKHKRPRTPPDRDQLFMLTVLRSSVLAALEYDKACAAAEPPPTPGGVWPGKRSFEPTSQPFAPTGFETR